MSVDKPQDHIKPENTSLTARAVDVSAEINDAPTLAAAATSASEPAAQPVATVAAASATENVSTADGTASTSTAVDASTADIAGVAAANAAHAANDAAADAAEAAAIPKFKMGDDVSAYTGRPRITKEENEALANGPRFFNRAMQSAAHARGEDYEPYRLPASMRAKLAQIDQEAAAEKRQEFIQNALTQGKSLDEAELMWQAAQEKDIFKRMHRLDSEEEAALAQEEEERQKQDIAQGGARFFHKYQALLQHQQEQKALMRAKMARNTKLIAAVMVALCAYVGYNHFLVDRDAQSIEELKSALPLTIDKTTTMVRIDDRNDDFKIFFEKDPVAFAGMSEVERDQALNNLQHNAPLLCKNQLLNHIIASGKRVTVLYEAADRSFFREFSIDKCPTLGETSAVSAANTANAANTAPVP